MTMTASIIIAIIIIAVAFFLREKREHEKHEGWRALWSKGVPGRPQGFGRGGWTLDFPTQAEGHLNYVMNFDPPKLREGALLTLRCRINGDGFTAIEYPKMPASATLMLQRKGDTGTAEGKYEAYRLYSGDMLTLKEGTFVMSVPLTPEHWGGIYGSHNPENFKAMLREIEAVGVVFGSVGGRGHGVYADVGSSFTLIRLA